jgi:hypothetical protein
VQISIENPSGTILEGGALTEYIGPSFPDPIKEFMDRRMNENMTASAIHLDLVSTISLELTIQVMIILKWRWVLKK